MREYGNQLGTNQFNNLNEMNKFLKRCNLLKFKQNETDKPNSYVN